MTTELHEYRRHLFTLTLTWFTWFIALNYGALAWLAVKMPALADRRWFYIVAALFLTQNTLGLIWFYKLARDTKTWATEQEHTSGSLGLYTRGATLLGFGLLTVAIAWTIFMLLSPEISASVSVQ